MVRFGSIEAGGTKFVCAVGTGPHDLQAEIRFPTTTPQETLERAITFFRTQAQEGPLQAIGIGAFGPLDPNLDSPTFGFITTTPKPHWGHIDFVGPLRKALNLPIYFDTDVNVAALGEHQWGAAQGLHTFVYLTVGTGIGGGAMVEGRLLHGQVHPEMGHMPIPHDHLADPYPGYCPYHHDCLEGLASGPAMQARWGERAEELPPDHPAWELEAHYLAQGIAIWLCTLSPQRIILGGGVMQQPHLFPLIREKVRTAINGYLSLPDSLDTFIVPPQLGNRAGILGALVLAGAR